MHSFQPHCVLNYNNNKSYSNLLKMPKFPEGKGMLTMFLLHTEKTTVKTDFKTH